MLLSCCQCAKCCVAVTNSCLPATELLLTSSLRMLVWLFVTRCPTRAGMQRALLPPLLPL